MDDTDILDAFDQRLDPLVPTGPAPVTDLVRRGHARRRRRHGLRAGLAAAVAVAGVAVGATVIPSTDRANLPTVAPTAPDPVVDAYRTVTFGTLSFDVPTDWADGDSTCFFSPSASIYLQAPGEGCDPRPQVAALDLDSTTGRQAEARTNSEEVVNGLVVRRGSACPANASCAGVGDYVVVPAAGVVLYVNGPDGTQPIIEAIVSSIDLSASAPRPVPDGYRLVGLDGVAVAIPEDWASCPISAGLSFGPPGPDGICDSPEGGLEVVTLTRTTGVSKAPAYTQQNGLTLLFEEGCGPAASCVNPFNRAATAVTEKVRVFVGGSTTTLVDTIVESVRAMPPGLAAVPDVDFPAPYSTVCRAVLEAGFRVGTGVIDDPQTCDSLSLGSRAGISPAPGTVLPLTARLTFLGPVGF